ncbi:neuronal cell adhesion molecule-like [Montipora capricornis]|uniref:neuronal cell adhesion molecule-like n=1 Tax=Montipora capricornis TaxID=246305 RepID=UPI0035F17B1D
MLLFITLICVYLKSSTSCRIAKNDYADPLVPTVELRTIEFPGDNILPTGYNVTIACISNSSKREPGYLDKPYWIQYYFNDDKRLLHDCGGSHGTVDSEANKVCTFFIQNATEKDSGNYSCWAYTQEGCARRKIELEFGEPQEPYFTVDLPNQFSAIIGQEATLTCQALGVPRPVITWFKDGYLLSSFIKGVKAQSTLTFHSLTLSDDHAQYWCEASNRFGSKRSSTVTLTVLMKPVFLLHPRNVSATLDDDVVPDITITCAAEGSPKPVITWLENNSTIVNETGYTQNGTMSILTLKIHKKRKMPNYRCRAMNTVGVTLSEEATITFLEKETTTVAGKPDARTDNTSTFLWSAVSIAVAAILLLLVTILVFFKQKQWRRANYQLNNELIKQQDLIQLHIKNDVDIINKLRLNSQATIVSISSSQDGTITTTDGQEPLDNELYLQTMATCNRNWEIPRDRITITHEKLGGGEFGLVNKGYYLRIDGQQLAVAVKRLKEILNCC